MISRAEVVSVALVVGTLALGACSRAGLQAQQSSQPASQQSGYLAESVSMGTDGSWAIFWDQDSGAWYAAQREGDEIIPLDGTASRHGSTLTVEVSCCATPPNLLRSGSYAIQDNGTGFTVSVPWSDGTVQSYPFNSDGITAYNNDVSKMKSDIASDQQAAARAEQEATQAAAQAAAAQQRRWAAIESTEEKSCAAVGGTLGGAANTDGTQDPEMNSCQANPNRQTTDQFPISCGGEWVHFEADGTISRTTMQVEKDSFPGCWN